MKTSQQNMTCTRCLSFILLLNFLFTLTSAEQSPFYMYSFCQNSTQKTPNPSHQSNVNNFLSWINSDSASGTVSNHTTISSKNNRDDDDVYGFYDCRGDVTVSFCQFCLNIAVGEIPQRCPNGVSSMIWFDVCIVGYTNKNSTGEVSVAPSWNVTGSKTVKDSTELAKAENNVRSLIDSVTTEGNLNWALGAFSWSNTVKRYGWVQCNRVLSKNGCKQCLEAMMDLVPKCCGTKVGWAVMSPSCGVKYDDYRFYQVNNQTGSRSPMPIPDKQEGASNTKTLIITLVSVLVAVSILSCCIYYCWRKNGLCKGGFLFRTIAFHDHVQREDPLNGDLPTIPLTVIQQSTNNFSESSKLGEGGYGPVYKGTLPDGTEVAVKRLAELSGQGSEEFKNEVIFIAKLQHRNLVKLLGCFMRTLHLE